jgi:hypothetical protein
MPATSLQLDCIAYNSVALANLANKQIHASKLISTYYLWPFAKVVNKKIQETNLQILSLDFLQ